MHIARRIAVLAFSLILLMMTSVCAEVPFLVHSSGWSLEGIPLDVLLKADVDMQSPFDKDRTAMLRPVTDLLSLRLNTGENAGSVTVGIAGEDKLMLHQQGNAVQISCVPGTAYTAEEDPLSLLLGAEVTVAGGYEALQLERQSEKLLADGRQMLAKFPAAFEKYGKKSQNTTSLSGYGKAAYCVDYTFTATHLKAFQDALLENCPEGWLRGILEALTFSGKQTVRIHFTKDDVMLRVQYSGVCGAKDDLRKVQLVVKMLHDDATDKDYIKLTSPAKNGKNRNDLTFERVVETNKAGARVLEGSFSYTKIKDEVKSAWSGEFEMQNAFSDAADVLSGEMSFRTQINNAAAPEEIIFTPAVTVTGTADAPIITGMMAVETRMGGNVNRNRSGKTASSVILSIDLKAGQAPVWTDCSQTIDLSVMDAQALAAEQQKVAASVATTLVRPLIVTMGKDAAWFFRDMPEAEVQAIIDAAAAADPRE